MTFDQQGIALLPLDNLYLEWVNLAGTQTEIRFGVREIGSANFSAIDAIRLFRFQSIVVALGGESQVPADPVNDPGNHGTFAVAISLYTAGFNVFMWDEDGVDYAGAGPVYAHVANGTAGNGTMQVAIVGYSHGGGSAYDLADRMANLLPPGSFTIPFASYVDAIGNSSGTDVTQQFQDEARFGQQGTLSTVWAPTGSRRSVIKHNGRRSVWVFAACHRTRHDLSR